MDTKAQTITTSSGTVPTLKSKAIHTVLQENFCEDIPLDFKTLYLEHIPQSWLKGDKRLINVMLLAGKKSVTRKWLLPECPTIITWRDIVTEIYRMEKITAHVNQRMETFLKTGKTGASMSQINGLIVFLYFIENDFSQFGKKVCLYVGLYILF